MSKRTLLRENAMEAERWAHGARFEHGGVAGGGACWTCSSRQAMGGLEMSLRTSVAVQAELLSCMLPGEVRAELFA